MSDETKNIFSDTVDMLDEMVEDYDFYGILLKQMSEQNSLASLNTKRIRKKIDESWITAIEAVVPALDKIIKKPDSDIIEIDEVKPIELSHHITARSMIDLGQHSDYIKEIDAYGNVIPSKILNVYREGTLLTYENKFINTLIDRLFIFVRHRYEMLAEMMNDESANEVELEIDMKAQDTRLKMGLKIETHMGGALEPAPPNPEQQALWERVSTLFSTVKRYISSPFIQAMGTEFVTPPIMRTNSIMKNANLKQCLNLWIFIESYDKVGYTFDEEQTSAKPPKQLVKQLYALLAFQYVVFKYNTDGELENNMGRKSRKAWHNVAPRFVRPGAEFALDDYNFYEVSNEKLFSPSPTSPKKRRLTADEAKIRDAVDYAVKSIPRPPKPKPKEQSATD